MCERYEINEFLFSSEIFDTNTSNQTSHLKQHFICNLDELKDSAQVSRALCINLKLLLKNVLLKLRLSHVSPEMTLWKYKKNTV